MQRLIKPIILLIGIAVSLTILGCPPPIITEEHGPVYGPAPQESGPPPWAPAHGHRAQHRYHYYPESSIYFDVGRKVYFYYYVDPCISVVPWGGIHIDLNKCVMLDMDADEPY